MLFEEYNDQKIEEPEEPGTEPEEPEQPEEPGTEPEEPEQPEGNKKYTKDKEYIFNKTVDYRQFFNCCSNGLVENGLNEPSVGIPEKIKGFNMDFTEEGDEGKSVKVRKQENGDIIFTFSKKGKTNSTEIILSNCINVGNIGDGSDQQKNGNEGNNAILNPTIRINGSTENLPIFLKKCLNDGENIFELSNNTDNFMKIFEALHENIIRSKIEEVHAYAEKIENNIRNNLNKSEFRDKRVDASVDVNQKQGELQILIKNLLSTELKSLDNVNLIGNKLTLVLALNSFLKGKGKSINLLNNEIKQILGYVDNKGKKQKDEEGPLDEDMVDFIPIYKESAPLTFFAMNYDIVIKQMIEEINNNPENFEGLFEGPLEGFDLTRICAYLDFKINKNE